MDLGAYAQIDDLSEIARRNGIEVPRLRGYRLMKDERYYHHGCRRLRQRCSLAD